MVSTLRTAGHAPFAKEQREPGRTQVPIQPETLETLATLHRDPQAKQTLGRSTRRPPHFRTKKTKKTMATTVCFLNGCKDM